MANDPIRLLRFEGGSRRDPAIDAWFERQEPALAALVAPWFDRMRGLGEDIRELMHDGAPTVCVGDAGLAYVNVYTAHANVGFFLGAWLHDSDGLLQGTGKRMRHVKIRPAALPDADALERLVRQAYAHMKKQIAEGAQ